jgi:hypothetical protein
MRATITEADKRLAAVIRAWLQDAAGWQRGGLSQPLDFFAEEG